MPTDDDIKKAWTAFKKRLKLTQLEDDSKLGRSPLTGAKSKVTAIQLPRGFEKEVWEALVEKGVIAHDGGGFYAPTGKTPGQPNQ